MGVFTLILILALLGALTWAVITFIPMPAAIKNLIIFVAVVVAIIYTLKAFGIGIPNMSVPQVK